MGAATDKYRVQLDFTPEAFRELEKLKAEVGASSRADTLRRAMRVLRWTINTLQDGAQILVRRNGALSEIEFPFLSHAEPAEPATRDEQRKQAAEGRIYVQERAREARQQAIERADRAYVMRTGEIVSTVSATDPGATGELARLYLGRLH